MKASEVISQLADGITQEGDKDITFRIIFKEEAIFEKRDHLDFEDIKKIELKGSYFLIELH